MAKAFTLKVDTRKETGSRRVKKIRTAGKLPAVVYGHKQQPVAVTVDYHDFVEALHHGHRVFDADIEGQNDKLLVKDLQYDYLGKDIIHADFVRVNLTEKVQVNVPLQIKGTAAGAEEGGIIEEHLDSLEVECVVTEIPEFVEVSVKEVQIGDTIHAKDIKLPAGVELLTEPETLILACNVPKVVEEPEEEALEAEGEEPTEPERIGEKKEEAEQEGTEQE